MPEPLQPGDRIVQIYEAKKAITSACQTAKLPHFHHHSLRHFFCSNAIETGIDFKTIAGWLGHKDGGLLVAKTYGHLRDEHSAAMAKRMSWGASATEPANVGRQNAGENTTGSDGSVAGSHFVDPHRDGTSMRLAVRVKPDDLRGWLPSVYRQKRDTLRKRRRGSTC
jgi:hypothetical protein